MVAEVLDSAHSKAKGCTCFRPNHHFTGVGNSIVQQLLCFMMFHDVENVTLAIAAPTGTRHD